METATEQFDILDILKKNIINSILQFVNEIDLSFDYISKDIIKKLHKFIKQLETDNSVFYTKIDEVNTMLSLYNNNIYTIINSVRKIKKQDFEFLNDICLFNILDLKLFNDENKNTKKTLVEHLNTIYSFTNVLVLFKSGGNIEEYLEKLHNIQQSQEVDVDNKNDFLTDILKNKGRNGKNNDNNELNNLFNTLLNNPTIMNIAQDLSKNLEEDNVNPMNLLSSIMSGKPNATLNKLTKVIEDKINTGELNTQELESQAENIINITKNNKMLSSMLPNIPEIPK